MEFRVVLVCLVILNGGPSLSNYYLEASVVIILLLLGEQKMIQMFMKSTFSLFYFNQNIVQQP